MDFTRYFLEKNISIQYSTKKFGPFRFLASKNLWKSPLLFSGKVIGKIYLQKMNLEKTRDTMIFTIAMPKKKQL